jgi:hypothetical protein
LEILERGHVGKQNYKSCITPWGYLPPSEQQWPLLLVEALIHPYSLTMEADMLQTLTAYIAGEFYRLRFDSKFDLGRIPRGRGAAYQQAKQLVTTEALLWSLTWSVLTELASMGRLPAPLELSVPLPYGSQVTCWLMLLIGEFELLMQMQAIGFDSGAVHLLVARQGQNSSLKQFQNPFNRAATRCFVEVAIATAEENDQFRRAFYNPMITQRQKVTATLKSHSPRIFNLEGKIARQGRRK